MWDGSSTAVSQFKKINKNHRSRDLALQTHRHPQDAF